jgi:hypothetical protein
MKFARDLLLKTIGPAAEPEAAETPLIQMSGVLPTPPAPVSGRTRLFTAWIVILVGASALVALLWWLSGLFLHDHTAGFLADVVVAAAVAGFGALFVFPAKFITAFFGVLAGSSAQTALTGDGVFTQANGIVATLIAGFAVVFPGAAAELGQSTLHTGAYVFYGLVVAMSVPAFITN